MLGRNGGAPPVLRIQIMAKQMDRFFPMGNSKAGKLTRTQVIDIRVKYHQEEWSQGRLARYFGVTIGTIGRIVRGETWQTVQHPASARAAYQDESHIPLTDEQLSKAAKESEARLLKSLGMELGKEESAPPAQPEPRADWDSPADESGSSESVTGLDRFQAEVEKISEGAEARAEAAMKKFLGEGSE